MVLLALTVLLGLAVYAFGPDVAASDIAGDALYAVAVYLAVVIVVPRAGVLPIALVASTWCVAVELFQLTGLPLVWGAQFSPVMLALGTVFDARDLIVYLVAIVVVVVIDAVVRVMVSRASASR